MTADLDIQKKNQHKLKCQTFNEALERAIKILRDLILLIGQEAINPHGVRCREESAISKGAVL